LTEWFEVMSAPQNSAGGEGPGNDSADTAQKEK
jgi:hypothetical protein